MSLIFLLRIFGGIGSFTGNEIIKFFFSRCNYIWLMLKSNLLPAHPAPDVIWMSFFGLNQVGPSWPSFSPKIDFEIGLCFVRRIWSKFCQKIDVENWALFGSSNLVQI